MECCCCFFLTFETILWHLEITIKSHQVEKTSPVWMERINTGPPGSVWSGWSQPCWLSGGFGEWARKWEKAEACELVGVFDGYLAGRWGTGHREIGHWLCLWWTQKRGAFVSASQLRSEHVGPSGWPHWPSQPSHRGLLHHFRALGQMICQRLVWWRRAGTTLKSLWERDRSFAHFSFGDRVFIVSADYHLLVFIFSWDFIFFMIAYYIKKALGNRYYGIIVNRLPW